MVDNVSTAKVTINVNRNGGSTNDRSGSNYLKSMDKSLKSLKDVSSKSSKLGQAGFMTAGAKGLTGTGGGLLSFLLGSTAVSAAFAEWISDKIGRAGGSDYENESGGNVHVNGYYQEALVDGERRILEVNEQTGEVINILSEREAIEKGILDESGKIHENMRAYKGQWDKVRDEFEQHGKTLILSSIELESLLSEQQKSVLLQKEYNRLQRIINERKAREAHDKAVEYLESSGTRYTFSGNPISMNRPINYMDIVHQQQADERAQQQSQQQCSFVEDVWPGALQ